MWITYGGGDVNRIQINPYTQAELGAALLIVTVTRTRRRGVHSVMGVEGMGGCV